MRNVKVSDALGLFGIGLGLIELCAPRWLSRKIGTNEKRRGVMRAFGAREIGAGILILASRKKLPVFGLAPPVTSWISSRSP
jgi:hypothetical protein